MSPVGQALLYGAPAAGLLLNVLAHIGLARFRRGRAPVTDLLRAAAIGGAGMLALGLAGARAGGLPFSEAAGAVLLGAMTYTALAWCYLNFVNLNLSSLRFRLLHELRLASDGWTEQELVDRYNAGQVISRRLEQLTAGRHLRRREDRYVVGHPLLLVAFDLLEALKIAVLGHGSLLIHGRAGHRPGAATMTSFQRISRMARIVWSYAFLRFILVGLLNTLFSFCLYSLLVLAGVPYALALTLTSLVAQIWNFTTTGRLVFGNRRKRLIVRFLAVSGTIYVLNLSSLALLVEVFGVGEVAAQALLVPLVITASFLINRSWVFRHRLLDPPGENGDPERAA